MEVPKFRLNYFFSLIFTNKYKYCYGLGYSYEEIALEILSRTTMRDCYKVLIQSLCNRSTTWTGQNAKYIDKCGDSMFVTATVKEFIYREETIDQT